MCGVSQRACQSVSNSRFSVILLRLLISSLLPLVITSSPQGWFYVWSHETRAAVPMPALAFLALLGHDVTHARNHSRHATSVQSSQVMRPDRSRCTHDCMCTQYHWHQVQPLYRAQEIHPATCERIRMDPQFAQIRTVDAFVEDGPFQGNPGEAHTSCTNNLVTHN